MLIFLKNLYRKIGLNTQNFYTVKRSEQEDFLKLLGEAESALERSFKQYKCQTFIMRKITVVLLNIASFFIKPFYLIFLQLRKIKTDTGYDAVFISGGISEETIPVSVLVKYKTIKTVPFAYRPSLTRNDVIYMKKLFQGQNFSPYFTLKIYIKMSMYSTLIRLYHPKAIISYVESSFTSQVMTEWLESKGIKHINIMHGEKLYLICDSFAYFSSYYVWDEHYKNLMVELKADPKQFIVEKPNILNKHLNNQSSHPYYLTYYLGDENEEELIKIHESLKKIKDKGYRCKVRIHPRGNNSELVHRILTDFDLEDPNKISLNESLESTSYICSLNSTVLYEGYLNGKEVVIDDVSNKSRYNLMNELEYIMMYKKHDLLSKIIDQC